MNGLVQQRFWKVYLLRTISLNRTNVGLFVYNIKEVHRKNGNIAPEKETVFLLFSFSLESKQTKYSFVAPPGSNAAAHISGWMTEDNFVKYLRGVEGSNG